MTKETTALSAISNNVVVGLDEVVAVFVSRYEDDLYSKRAEKATLIKELKQKIQNLTTSVINKLDTTAYEVTNDILEIKSVVDNVTVEWNNSRYSICVEIKNIDGSYGYISKRLYVALDVNDVAQHTDLVEKCTLAESEFMVLNNEIRDISRKERKVRARISEMKLREGGFTDLLENPELLALVNAEQFK